MLDLSRTSPPAVHTAPAERLYDLRRTNIIMRPLAGDEREAGGVLNPGGVRGPDGNYYLFPRLVATGNYSRIGIARVTYDAMQVPNGVERLGIALEPEMPYEKNPGTGGGCEDPRITYVPSHGVYVMAYVGYSPRGPRAALAVSSDLFNWTRLGPIGFAPFNGTNMNAYANKDAMIFPEAVPDPSGRPSIALLHRPMYEVWEEGEAGHAHIAPPPNGIRDRRWSMWISYCPLEEADWLSPHPAPGARPPRFDHHQVVIAPHRPWEALRLGGGTPPIMLPEGWFSIYHGIGLIPRRGRRAGLRYCAAAVVLDPQQPGHVLYRSPEPTLEPELPEERAGVVSEVVFPTAVDQRNGYLDVYYGMADACIGAARMSLRQD